MRIAITAAWLWAELRKPRDRAADFADAKVLGLTLRLSPNGVAAWSTRRLLPDGRYTRVALGLFPATGIAEARQRALQTQGALQGGADPVSLKRAAKAKAKADKARPSVADCWREYAHAKATSEQWGPAHARNADLFFSRGVAPVLGIRALADITRADWIRVITVEGKKGQGAKATALRLIRGFDAYSETAGWIERAVLPRKAGILAPPCAPRQHTPGDSDIIAIWNAAANLRPKARVYIRLLILTAARRSEAAGIRAGEVDLEAGLWRLPAGRSKNKTPHTMPLGAYALEELRSIWPTEPIPPRFCLLGETGLTGLQDFSRTKAALDAVIGNSAGRIHDLRRAARSTMARLGVPSDHAEAALNHISHRSALQRTYDTHRYEDEAISALRLWQAHVERLLDPSPGAEVVPLRRIG